MPPGLASRYSTENHADEKQSISTEMIWILWSMLFEVSHWMVGD